MKEIILFTFIIVFITTTLAQYNEKYGSKNNQRYGPKHNQNYGPLAWWHTDENHEYLRGLHSLVPFPKCLQSGPKSRKYDSSYIKKSFDKNLRDEENYSRNEGYRNHESHFDDMMDNEQTEMRKGYHNDQTSAPAATTMTKDYLNKHNCDLDGTDSNDINYYMNKVNLPDEYCSYLHTPNCTGKIAFRTINGLCNNLQNPYEGSSQTAYKRILRPRYADGVSKPITKSRSGEPLPSCRHVSLTLGSEPKFDRHINNFFVIFGQVIAHDITLATPVSDTYSSPISSCHCGSKNDWNKCTVIPIGENDPYLGGQKCMAFPATAQAFGGQKCTLGVKEQINGNTHTLDLSILYGSVTRTAELLRAKNGRLKSTRLEGCIYELPPRQREGKSCTDETDYIKCFAAGDSRLMVNLLFTGIDAIFLRLHNLEAEFLRACNPTWDSNMIYETTREITIGLFQVITYGAWLPLLLGKDVFTQELLPTILKPYNENVPPVVYNEVAVAALRCHTLVRDIFTRVTYDGKRIDELWLTDINNKAKYAYDTKNACLDSIIIGSLYDYGFAHDGYFAPQLQHRLFETKDGHGYTWRNDLISINVCRLREHGTENYNAYREFCGLPRAYYFDDFGDVMNYKAIRKLQKLYKHVDDVELFPALNSEDALPGALVGYTSACLLVRQFQVLAEGDRFFFSHYSSFLENVPLNVSDIFAVGQGVLATILCTTVNVEKIPVYAFQPPNERTNPLISCSRVIEIALAERLLLRPGDCAKPTQPITIRRFNMEMAAPFFRSLLTEMNLPT